MDGTVSYTLSGLQITGDPVADTLSRAGTLQCTYNATVRRENGTEVVRHRTGTVAFEGSCIFIVTSADGSYRCSLVDGSLVR